MTSPSTPSPAPSPLPSTPVPAASQSHSTSAAPWYLHVAVGIGVWIGASVLAGGVGLILAVIDSWIPFLICAIPLLVASYFLCRVPPAVFKPHLIFSLSLAGQSCLFWAIREVVPSGPSPSFEILLGIQIAVFVLFDDFAHRIATALVITTILLVSPSGHWLRWLSEGVFIGQALLLALLGVRDVPLFRRIAAHPLVRPLTWSAVVTVPTLALFYLPLRAGWASTLHAIVLGGILVGFFWLIAGTFRTDNAEDAVKTKVKIAFGVAVVVLILALTGGNVALVLALLMFAIGHQIKVKAIEVVAVLVLTGGLTFTYYSLETTLLLKSLAVVGTGVGLLVAAVFARRLLPAVASDRPPSTFATRRTHSKDKLVMAAVGLAICLVIGGLCIQKEVHKRTGTPVVLKLRPQDPRSIMQGDYMRLRVEVAEQVKLTGSTTSSNSSGFVVVKPDDEGIARFVRTQPEVSPTSDGEIALQYKRRSRKTKVGPTEFFFEEGKGKHMAKARFAQMRANGSGKLLLEKLLDAEQNPL